jgi:hypothetical protein
MAAEDTSAHRTRRVISGFNYTTIHFQRPEQTRADNSRDISFQSRNSPRTGGEQQFVIITSISSVCVPSLGVGVVCVCVFACVCACVCVCGVCACVWVGVGGV